MEIPVLFKDVEINQRTFRLNKMDARTGSYMIYRLSKMIAPVFKNIKLESKKNSNSVEEGTNLNDLDIAELISCIFDLPEKDFRYVQDNCLQVIEEILPAGPTKVLDKYGSYGVLDIEFDTALLMNLTIQSLIFNVTGFFEGRPLDSIMKVLNISLPNLQM